MAIDKNDVEHVEGLGPSDLMEGVQGNRRMRVSVDERSRDPFHQILTAEYTPLVERKPLPGISEIRDRWTGTKPTVANGEIVIDGTTKTALYTRNRGRYLPGLYGLAGIGVRADWATGAFEYGYGDDIGNRMGIEWASGVPYTFVESFGSRYYRKARSEWLDPLDGTGPSQLSADLSQHVMRMRIGWYGYLRIEFFISVASREDGDQMVLVDRASLPSGVSFEQPDLPVFAEADGGTLYVGGRQFGVFGRYRPEFRQATLFADKNTIGTTLVPVSSMRIKSADQWMGVSAVLDAMTVLATANAKVSIIIGGTLTGASWGAISGIDAAETALEADTSATAITGGYLAFGDAVAGGTGSRYGVSNAEMPDIKTPPGVVVTLAVQAVSGTTDVVTALRLREEW